MAGEWRKFTIGELADLFDGPHATPPKTTIGPIFLGISNLAQGRLDLGSTEHLSEKDYTLWTRRIEPQAGDIVFSYETRLGEAALLPAGLRCCLGRRMGLLRAHADKVDKTFLLYAYLGPNFQETLRSRTIHGSTVDRIPLIDMPGFPIEIPAELAEQRAIAHILGTLDDKIELNRRMNETLEEMARALFKSWFVDFEPVCERAEELIQRGILEIGDGYRAKNSELSESGLPFIRAGDLDKGFDTTGADILGSESVARAGNKLSRPGDIAFTSKGTIGRFARVAASTDPFVYSPQICFWRSLDREKLHPAVLYCWMLSEDFKSQIAAVAGQTDMAPYVSLRDQRQMKVPVFDESQLSLGREIEPLLARQDLIMLESHTLVTLRATLLPKLLSGELRIENAERFTESLD
jgi:type I restriction enzyme S subunit